MNIYECFIRSPSFDSCLFLPSIVPRKVSVLRQLFMRKRGVKNRSCTMAISRSIYIQMSFAYLLEKVESLGRFHFSKSTSEQKILQKV